MGPVFRPPGTVEAPASEASSAVLLRPQNEPRKVQDFSLGTWPLKLFWATLSVLGCFGLLWTIEGGSGLFRAALGCRGLFRSAVSWGLNTSGEKPPEG